MNGFSHTAHCCIRTYLGFKEELIVARRISRWLGAPFPQRLRRSPLQCPIRRGHGLVPGNRTSRVTPPLTEPLTVRWTRDPPSERFRHTLREK